MLTLLRRFARLILLITGFLLVALFIWFAGPLFEFAEFRPLESATVRIYAIVLVIGVWMLWRLVRRLRANRASDNLVAAVLKQAVPEKAQPSAEQIKLRERFEEATATLKQKRKSGQSLYELPWYVIIGAPGSGKTTALVNSGLKFPLEARGGRALKGVGGTRNCDWWFAEEAVFLDTAGRYTTQDSDAASDSEGWAEFLSLLRKYRKRRPINGVILTISAQDLMLQSEAKREEQVEAARRRLVELNRELRIQMPVYLMVTKCDLVAGFTEYFDDLSLEGRAQVWGVTFPYEHTLSGDAAQTFSAEFDDLMERLNQRVLGRVEEDREVKRRTRVFAFPQQMAALREPLVAFVGDVFGSSRFDQQILLRGVYLTSGTQEGTPIDRLMGAIGRGFGLTSEAVAPTSGRGKAYFVERLLKEVLIGESGLAGLDRRGEVAKAAMHLGAYAAVALITVLGLAAFTVSHQRNRAYLDSVGETLAAFEKVPPAPPSATPERIATRLEAVRLLSESANQHQSGAPFSMRWGLYQGNAIGNAARDAYMREVDSVLLPHVATRFRQRVIEQSKDPEALYDALKAYLMLSDSEHLDPPFLEERADVEWGGTTGQSRGPGTVTLATHFKNRLAVADPLPPLPLDAAVIANARRAIQQTSVAEIIYRAIQRQYAEDTSRIVSLEAATAGAAGVIRRKSGITLSQPLPSIYSRSVFNDVTDTGSTMSLIQRFAGDDWVMGEASVSAGDSVKLTAAVIAMYERDYIDAWNRVLADLELARARNVEDVTRALEVLGGPASPLRGLAALLAEHTNFTNRGVASAAVETTGQRITEQLGRLAKPLQEAAGVSTITPGRLITAHFQPYHRLVAGDPGQTPIDRLIALHAQLHQAWLAAAATGDITKAIADPAVGAAQAALRQEANTLPPAFRMLVAQTPEAVTTVVSGAIDESNRVAVEAERDRLGTIRSLFREQVLPECTRIVSGRYPFTQGSDRDVPLMDFASLFGHNGIFDSFFRTHLEPLTDTTRSPWRWQPGAAANVLPADWLRVFEDAAKLREVFFQGGAKLPHMQFSVMLLDFDRGATRFQLDIEGAVLDSQAPKRTYGIRWPGAKPGFVQASFEGRFAVQQTEEYHGPWAWFRLLERSPIQRESDIRNVVTVNVKGLQAHVVIEALTVHNPFASGEWQRFKCGS
jgi:type VI secretion system protein ImpL